MKHLKWKLSVIVIIMLLVQVGCEDKILYEDVAPQLEVIVKNESGGFVSGAVVSLYETKEDWMANTHVIQSKETDNTGSALFTDLEEIPYYFWVEKEEMTNLNEISETGDPLKINVKAIIVTTIK